MCVDMHIYQYFLFVKYMEKTHHAKEALHAQGCPRDSQCIIGYC